MKQALYAASGMALALAGAVSASPQKMSADYLSSSRLNKRDLNAEGNYNMSFFHINDVHSHLDQFTSSGADCEDPSVGCFGGYARVKNAVDELRPQYNNSLWLNAGDEFQGTLFYTYYGPWKIGETINQLGFDALTLGNHEFDGGDDELGEFLQNLTFPVLGANIESNHTVLNETILPYKIFEDQGVAVIGCTTETTPNIANPGPGTLFHDVVSSVQRAIDEIRATTDIVRIVALTHIGYEEDMELAEQTTGLSLIMGGHSHTPLGDLNPDSEGPYPTVVEDAEGNEVFVVQAWRWGEYLGYIDVVFDDEGHALSYSGGPIHMDNTTAMDEELQKQILSWREPFEEFAAEVVGSTNADLVQSTCQREECTLGNVMADAMSDYRNGEADFALVNAGGIRAGIEAGDITRGQVLTSFPFGNAVTDLTFSGEDLWAILEGAVSRENQFNFEPVTSGFQVSSEIRIRYNPDLEPGGQLVSVEIGGEDLDRDAEYTVVTLDFLAGGGDNIFETTTNFIPLDLQDEVLIRYLEEYSPLDPEIEGRIVQTDDLPSGGGGGNTTASASVSASVSPTSLSLSQSETETASATSLPGTTTKACRAKPRATTF